LDSSRFLVADALVSVMFTPVASSSSQLAAFVDSAEARSAPGKVLGKTKLDTRQSKLYLGRDGRTTIPVKYVSQLLHIWFWIEQQSGNSSPQPKELLSAAAPGNETWFRWVVFFLARPCVILELSL
jgi:hypothetical protein